MMIRGVPKRGSRSTDRWYAGDNRLMTPLRALIDGVVWFLDVDSSHPGVEEGPKGSVVQADSSGT
ncbi:hypothetical protein Scep_030968 [Stephania cephalantha]|uniref:Uncharacterized protein n=1 Tax=Stephania cephalantha TaxID=152367 RepID=A0AAP0E1P3_9MAGN